MTYEKGTLKIHSHPSSGSLAAGMVIDRIDVLEKLLFALQNDIDRLLQRVPKKEDIDE